MKSKQRGRVVCLWLVCFLSASSIMYITKQLHPGSGELIRLEHQVLNVGPSAANLYMHLQPPNSSLSTDPTTPAPEIVIKEYLEQETKRCVLEAPLLRNRTSSSAEMTSQQQLWCPCTLPGLKGRLVLNTLMNFTWESLYADHPDVLMGGQWSPPHCRSRTNMAVIIPCRDRDDHLRTMLRHLYIVLKRQLIHFRIFVVEQHAPAIFNKAAMMNIGFLEASKLFHFDCVVFHDVDHLQEDDRMLLNCGDVPHHYAFSLDEWNYKMIYGGLFGGVVNMRPHMFRAVNGYCVRYFGWGAEDDDMGTRVRQLWPVFRPPFAIARYTTLKHLNDAGNHKTNKRGSKWNLNESYMNRTFIGGIDEMSYTVNEIQQRPMYTWIHANLNVSNLPYPTHVARQYDKIAGECTGDELEEVTLQTSEVSWVTCRYQCDRRGKKCAAFTYKRQGKHRCVLLHHTCDVTLTQDGVFTFVPHPAAVK